MGEDNLAGFAAREAATAPPEPPSPPYYVFGYQIQRLANAMAARYGAPVYLCGSALTNPKPNDYDVRVVMPEAELARMFGADDSNEPRTLDDLTAPREWRILRECLKQSRRLSRTFAKNVDFQIQSQSDAKRYEDKGRVRLDRASEEFFEAGQGDA